MNVDVCICTYRRDSIRQTLGSIAAQTIGREYDVRVIIADNDVEPTARTIIEELKPNYRFQIKYVHVPAKNISRARNACLDLADGDFIAFIDDDLEASPRWLEELCRSIIETGADAVFGPVYAIYPDHAATWLKCGDFHSLRPPQSKKLGINTGYTCNVMLKKKLAKHNRFDENFGQTGGEDTIFFFDAWKHGARYAFNEKAIIREKIVEERLNLIWLLKRAFRSGQSQARIASHMHRHLLVLIPLTAAKIAYCALSGMMSFLSPSRFRAVLLRGALHSGTFATLIGFGDLKIYR